MISDIQSEIIKLKKEKGVTIFAHTYQSHDIIEVADVVGDSFFLSKKAKEDKNPIAVVCGVHFMAETVKISQLAKDLEIKSKDLVTLFTELGMTKQTGGALEKDEVSFVIQALMDRFPIDDINDYIDGKYKVKPTAQEIAEQEAAAKAEAERIAAEKAEAERIAAEKAEAERIARAKELLTEAGYPDGFAMTITVPSNYQPHVDTAQVVGLESKTYWQNRKERSPLLPVLSAREAEQYVSSLLKVNDSRLCLIPSGEEEILCWQFTCTAGNTDVLVYINAFTGAQEEILQVVESAAGIETV